MATRTATDEERAELARRVKAARAYAGLTNQAALADKLAANGFDGYREPTIRTLEQGGYKKPKSKHWLTPIARACRLPVEFFEIDFAEVGDVSPLDGDDYEPAGGLLHELQGELPSPEGQDESDAQQRRRRRPGGGA